MAQLRDGTRIPDSGVQDAEVEMEMVAKPVMDVMFSDKVEYTPGGAEGAVGYGLLVNLDFNSIGEQFVVQDTSSELSL